MAVELFSKMHQAGLLDSICLLYRSSCSSVANAYTAAAILLRISCSSAYIFSDTSEVGLTVGTVCSSFILTAIKGRFNSKYTIKNWLITVGYGLYGFSPTIQQYLAQISACSTFRAVLSIVGTLFFVVHLFFIKSLYNQYFSLYLLIPISLILPHIISRLKWIGSFLATLSKSRQYLFSIGLICFVSRACYLFLLISAIRSSHFYSW